MKRFIVLFVLLMCALPAPSDDLSPIPGVIKVLTDTIKRLRPAVTASLVALPPASAPTWTFPGLAGDYRLEASTNLIDWWSVAVVYGVTNISLTSDTVHRQSVMFYRVLPAN